MRLCRSFASMLGLLFAISVVTAVAVSAESTVIPLWPDGAPGAVKNTAIKESQSFWNGDSSWPILYNVTDASLEMFFPEKGKQRGQAVIICPGGGYHSLNIEKEGRAIARWMAERGIVGCVLKYRLPNPSIMTDPSVGPLQDGQEAIRQVRHHAKGWGINPASIGIMGFSSGGHLAATVSTLYSNPVYKLSDDTSARPDFVVLVYPVISMRPELTPDSLRHDLLGAKPNPERVRLLSPELQVDAKTPPTFIAHAKKDSVAPSVQSSNYAAVLEAAKVPVELHLYDQGDHAFALGALPDWPRQWPTDLEQWLNKQRR